MKNWEKDRDGWMFLNLPDGWVFTVDTNVKANKGYDVYLSKRGSVLTEKNHLTKHGNYLHALRMCERLRRNGGWKNYLPKQKVKKSWPSLSLSSVISKVTARFCTGS